MTIHSPDKDRIPRHKLEGGDHAGLLALIERFVSGHTNAGGGPRGGELLRGGLRRVLAASAADGGRDNEPRVRPCEHCGRSASPAGEDRPGRWREDAAHADGVLRGEPRVVRVVRVPSPSRNTSTAYRREQQRLTKEQTAHTNRIKALLRLWACSGEPTPTRLAELAEGNGIGMARQCRHGSCRDQARTRAANAGARAT